MMTCHLFGRYCVYRTGACLRADARFAPVLAPTPRRDHEHQRWEVPRRPQRLRRASRGLLAGCFLAACDGKIGPNDTSVRAVTAASAAWAAPTSSPAIPPFPHADPAGGRVRGGAQGEEPADRHAADRRGGRAGDDAAAPPGCRSWWRPGRRAIPSRACSRRRWSASSATPSSRPASRRPRTSRCSCYQRRLRLRSRRRAPGGRRRVPAPGAEPPGQLREDRLAAGAGGAPVHRGADDATGS